MSRILYKKDIEEVLWGATFLGAGGGGSLQFGLSMLEKLVKDGVDIQLELVSVDEIEENDYVAMVAGLGSPVALLEGSFGPDAVYAFKAFQKAFAAEGKQVKYLYSGEMGGFNSFVPMMVSILSDEDPKKRIPFVDADGNGRAVPELNTSLGSARGYPPYPIGLGNAQGDMVIAYPTSDKAAETIARQLCMAYGMKIGFSTWGLSREELRNNAHIGCITYAQEVGKAILAAKDSGKIADELKKAMELREVCVGTVEKIDLKAEGGFDFGITTILADDGKTYYIDFKNENLLVRGDASEAFITVPDLICLLDADKCYPLTNADVKEGMRVFVCLSPAHPFWWADDKKAYSCWTPLLEKVGYSGELVKY